MPVSEKQKPSINKSRQYLALIALLLVGLGLVLFGVNGYVRRQLATTGPAEHIIASEAVTSAPSRPSEKDITSFPAVPADQPRSIELPTLDIKGFIQKVGVDSMNAVAVPTNVALAGWYTNSIKPGEIGVSLIDGHVQGRYKEGIFKHLSSLKKSDVFYVYYGDGSRRSFAVAAVREYSAKEAADMMLKTESGIERQLNLITCSGSFDKNSQQYEKRTIVVARSVNEP